MNHDKHAEWNVCVMTAFNSATLPIYYTRFGSVYQSVASHKKCKRYGMPLITNLVPETCDEACVVYTRASYSDLEEASPMRRILHIHIQGPCALCKAQDETAFLLIA